MGTIEDKLEDENGRKDDFDGRLSGVKGREASDLAVDPPDQLQRENCEGET